MRKQKRPGTDPETLTQLALWYSALRETTVPTFLPLFADTHRYLVLKGGGGSGKSIFAGRKILERATSEPGHRFLVVRKVGKTLRESCFEQMKAQAYEHYPDEIEYIPKGKSGDMYIRCKNGSLILFVGLDDPEKLKSIFDITGIWVEEASELREKDFNQLDIRLRTETPYYLQIIVCFNPISIKHWLKKRFFDRKDRRAKVHESTYKDNPFLRKEAIETLEAFKDTDEYYYQVYCLGIWGVTGKTVFDGRAVTARLLENIRPEKTGYFEYDDDGLKLSNIRFVEDKNGFVKIYKNPEAGVPYVIGGDTAGDGSDSFVGQVLDNRTGEQVCTLRHTFDEDLYAKQMFCLGTYYNTALIGIETNYSTYPVMELERLRYPKQYVRESLDDYTHKLKQSFGFQTNTKTRPVIIAQLIRAARDDIRLICDESTLEEMLTFVRGEDWKPQAEEGAHDDCIMALAIAHYIRPQQCYLIAEEAAETVQWTADQWEDYERASEAEKAYLIERWGQPRR